MMKNLHFNEYFKNFLFDLNNFISIYENNFHVFNYTKLNKLQDDEIIITMANKIVTIKGVDLKVIKMTKQELLIKGEVLKVEFTYA